MNIRSLDRVRRIFENIYTYGFNTRGDFTDEKLTTSNAAYDQVIKLLRDLYYDEIEGCPAIIKAETLDGGKYKQYKFVRNTLCDAGEQLIAAYGLFSIDDDAIKDIIKCMSIISHEDGATVGRIVQTYTDDEEGADKSLRVRRRLDDLCVHGFLESGLCGVKKKTYHINDMLSEKSDKELIDLYYLTSLFAGAGYPRVPALFLKKAIQNHMAYRYMKAPTDVFIFRDSVCANIFDEQVVYTLLDACKDSKRVSAKVRGKECVIKPVYLKIDTKLGRWYLLAICKGRPNIIKVANITDVKVLDEIFDYDEAESAVNKKLRYSYISNPENTHPIDVEAELRMDSDHQYVRKQFEREIFVGGIERRGDIEVYHAVVSDVTELKPFLRSYAGYLKVLPSEYHTLDKELNDEYREMLRNYGGCL